MFKKWADYSPRAKKVSYVLMTCWAFVMAFVIWLASMLPDAPVTAEPAMATAQPAASSVVPAAVAAVAPPPKMSAQEEEAAGNARVQAAVGEAFHRSDAVVSDDSNKLWEVQGEVPKSTVYRVAVYIQNRLDGGLGLADEIDSFAHHADAGATEAFAKVPELEWLQIYDISAGKLFLRADFRRTTLPKDWAHMDYLQKFNAATVFPAGGFPVDKALCAYYKKNETRFIDKANSGNCPAWLAKG